MLRLELRDDNDTVLFMNPESGVNVHKINGPRSHEGTDIGISITFAAGTARELMHTMVWYKSQESRDAAYEYALTKIDEYFETPSEPTPINPEKTEPTMHCFSCKACDPYGHNVSDNHGYCLMKGEEVGLDDAACNNYIANK